MSHRVARLVEPSLAVLSAARLRHRWSSRQDGSQPANDTVYLFTSFRDNGEDGLRFLSSEDGYHWTEVPGTFLKPRVGPSQLMRDPSLLRGPDGTYHLVWTTGWQGDQGFGYAHSKDLVHWSEQTVRARHGARADDGQRLGPGAVLRRAERAIHHLLGVDDPRPLSRTTPSRTTTTSGCTTRRRATSKPSRRPSCSSIPASA